MRIPNLIPLLLVAGFVLQAAFGGVAGITGHLLAMLIVLALLMPLFALNALGGGDVKLLAAVGAMLGLHAVVAILFNTLLVAAVIGLLFGVVLGEQLFRATHILGGGAYHRPKVQ